MLWKDDELQIFICTKDSKKFILDDGQSIDKEHYFNYIYNIAEDQVEIPEVEGVCEINLECTEEPNNWCIMYINETGDNGWRQCGPE